LLRCGCSVPSHGAVAIAADQFLNAFISEKDYK
jgi:hypothetical protein